MLGHKTLDFLYEVPNRTLFEYPISVSDFSISDFDYLISVSNYSIVDFDFDFRF